MDKEKQKERLEKYLSQCKATEASFPFGPEAMVFKIMGKMFALVSQNEKNSQVTLKCKPADAEILTSQFESIVPGYHMNKKHWITISLNGEIPEEMILDLADGSYGLVTSKLTRADKNKLNLI
ncbi:MAG: MmcQ/YjbR family DNA-binding protein [Gammaproteobacteria bacterium]|nr:MmcQ/YjbR family DNA-binding protein [Gammaproteobacteria bacterium]